MSPVQILAFPDERIVRRMTPADPSQVTLAQAGESLTFDSPDAFWASIRAADPELKRRLADAADAIASAEALHAKARDVLQREAWRADTRRQLAKLLGLCALGGVGCALIIFGWS